MGIQLEQAASICSSGAPLPWGDARETSEAADPKVQVPFSNDISWESLIQHLWIKPQRTSMEETWGGELFSQGSSHAFQPHASSQHHRASHEGSAGRLAAGAGAGAHGCEWGGSGLWLPARAAAEVSCWLCLSGGRGAAGWRRGVSNPLCPHPCLLSCVSETCSWRQDGRT